MTVTSARNPPASADPPSGRAPGQPQHDAMSYVGIGVGILVLRNGQILLGRRLSAHGAGTWAAPGGKLEFGEGFEECAARELAEETGLELGPTQIAGVCNDVFDELPAHYVTVMLMARATRGEPVNAEPHKCAGWQWFSWDALPQPLFAPLATLVAGGWRPDDAPPGQ